MDWDQCKEYAKEQLESYLDSITHKKSNKYVCPLCNSGEKKNGTPAGSITADKKYFHCFSCGFHGDVISLIGAYEGIIEDRDKFIRAYEIFNIVPEKELKRGFKTVQTKNTQNTISKNKTQETADKTSKKTYTEYINRCKAHAQETDYFTKRGLSSNTVINYNLGYDVYKKAVVIPYDDTNTYYATRSVEGKSYLKPKSSEAGSEPIFNINSLYNRNNQPVFVVEGHFDALSILELGFEAICIGGTSGVNKLLNQLQKKPTNNTLIISFDNDKAGQEATDNIEKELQNRGISYVKSNISGECKDANEALIDNKNKFNEYLLESIKKTQVVEETKKRESEEQKQKYILDNSVIDHLDSFLGQIKKSVDTPAIPTNFIELDRTLDDGFYEGLYIMGAISSLGKTSFLLQIADQIAQQQQDVLIFSLEMSISELIAKSISRITFLSCDGMVNNAKTTRGILAGKRHATYSREEKQLINDSILKYASYADHLYVFEGIGDIGVAQIRQAVEKHIKITGIRPVVIIDYLQILSPIDIRASDKQNTDRSVFELKRLSRDCKIPIIGISSLNRDNYNTSINMAAFKESGAIEYSSDVLIGLQFELVNGEKITPDVIDQLKRKQPRKIELKVLKNRNGTTGDIITFDYFPMFNYFSETGKKAPNRLTSQSIQESIQESIKEDTKKSSRGSGSKTGSKR